MVTNCKNIFLRGFDKIIATIRCGANSGNTLNVLHIRRIRHGSSWSWICQRYGADSVVDFDWKTEIKAQKYIYVASLLYLKMLQVMMPHCLGSGHSPFLTQVWGIGSPQGLDWRHIDQCVCSSALAIHIYICVCMRCWGMRAKYRAVLTLLGTGLDTGIGLEDLRTHFAGPWERKDPKPGQLQSYPTRIYRGTWRAATLLTPLWGRLIMGCNYCVNLEDQSGNQHSGPCLIGQLGQMHRTMWWW